VKQSYLLCVIFVVSQLQLLSVNMNILSPTVVRAYFAFLLFFAPTAWSDAFAQDYERNPVSFSSGKETLQGTLLKPSGVGPFPVLVFLPGSGESSYRTNYKPFVEEVLEVPLAGQSIAIMYFDKRGIGGSTSHWRKSDFYNRAADAIAAIQYLKTLQGIDSNRIGVIGHSQGGWIAMMCAGLYREVAFGASLAGPTVGVREQLTMDYASEYRCAGMEYTTALEKAGRKANRVLFASSILPFGNLGYIRRIRNFKPDEAIGGIDVPFLMLFARNDPLVYATPCVERLKEIGGGSFRASLPYAPSHLPTTVLISHPCALTLFRARPMSGQLTFWTC
jgi:uncharacterized protein